MLYCNAVTVSACFTEEDVAAKVREWEAQIAAAKVDGPGPDQARSGSGNRRRRTGALVLTLARNLLSGAHDIQERRLPGLGSDARRDINHDGPVRLIPQNLTVVTDDCPRLTARLVQK